MKTLKKSNAKNLIIKHRSEGIFIRPQRDIKLFKEDKIEAMNLSAKDTAGAGILLAVTSMSLATGLQFGKVV